MKNDFLPTLSSQVSGYQIDSRYVTPGDLFFAIKGEKSDGHDFLGDVRSREAVGAVVSKSYNGPDHGLILIRVDDVGEALRDYARKSLEGYSGQIVGITGSVGKTTTKDFIATLLEGKYRVGKTEKSQNSKLTFPLTVLNRAPDVEILVLEMGMSEMGDIERLVDIAPPDVAVLTKVALAHAAYFPGGLSDIAKGKGEIFSHPKTKMGLFDRDFLRYDQKIACEKQIFSEEDCQGIVHPFKELHLIHNLSAAVRVARYFGMTNEEINARIPYLQLPKMRFERFEKNGIFFINDAYNANPASVMAALQALEGMQTSGKKIAVLGSMKELGTFSFEAHKEVGLYAQKVVDHLLVMGEEAKPMGGVFFESHQEIGVRLKEIMGTSDIVLIKGSRSMSMETVLCYCGF